MATEAKALPSGTGNPDNFRDHPAVAVITQALDEAQSSEAHWRNTKSMTYAELLAHDARVICRRLREQGYIT